MPIYKGSTPINLAATTHSHTVSDITDAGTAASLDVGTGANNIVQLNGSAQLPAVDGSLLTGITGGGAEVFRTQTPLSTQTHYLFEDFLGINSSFLNMGVSGGYWRDSLLFSGYDCVGAVKFQTAANAYARGIIQCMQVFPTWSDGDQWLFQIRALQNPNASATSQQMNLSAFCGKTDLNDQTTEQGSGYGDTAKAGIYGAIGNTYWKSFVYDNEGTNGGATTTDITSQSFATDVWVVLGIHAKYVAASSGWVITSYMGGTQVAQETLTSGTYAPQPYFNFYNDGDALVNYGLVDWVSFQYTRKSSVTLIDIEDL